LIVLQLTAARKRATIFLQDSRRSKLVTEEKKMAEGRCRLNRELAREDSLDSSNFPEVLQRSLQREMTERVEPAPYERAQKGKGHCNEKPRTLKNRPAAPGLSPIEMLWRYFRREVNHCELFARIKILVTTTYDFFDRYNRSSRFSSRSSALLSQGVCERISCTPEIA
jgi:hypothetical protein